jgi:anti-sigma factor RsiW
MKKADMNNTMNCKTCQTHLPDLLLDDSYAAAHPEVAGHLASCEPCAKELAELRATYALLDAWPAPEPSPYFDSRLRARVREAANAQPEGLFERMYAFLRFSTGFQLRSAMAGALMLVVLVGGGTFAGFYEHSLQSTPQPSATVNDLKILDNNAQALQQMDQLLDPNANDDSGDPPTT